MAVTHETAVRNGLADYTVDLIDTGTASPNLGYLEFQTSGDVECATVTGVALRVITGSGAIVCGDASVNGTESTPPSQYIFEVSADTRTFVVRRAS